MADFNAGSIVADMDVDRDPFTEGLKLAKQQAQEFEDKKINPKIELDDAEAKTEFIDMQARADALSDSKIGIPVDVDDAKAKAELDELQAKVDKLDGETININTKESVSQVDELGNATERAIGNSGGSGGGGHGMLGLVGAAIALAPALAPGVASIGGFGAAAVGGFAQAGVALGAFGLVAKSDFADMQKSTKALAKAQTELETATTTQQKAKAVRDLAAAQADLVGPMGQAAKAFAGFQTSFDKLKNDTSGPVFGVMTDALNLASRLLPQFAPIINTVAGALKDSVKQIGDALGGPGLGKFLDMIKGNIVPDIKDLTTGLINFGGGFAKIIEAVNPLTQELSHGVANISQGFNDWATNLANGGIQPFLDYLKKNGPAFNDMLSAIGGAIVSLAKGLAPLVGPAMQFLTAFGKAVSQIDVTKLAKSVGDLLVGLIPLLPVLVQLLNNLIDLVDVVVPVLIPAIQVLADVLGFLLSGPLGTIVTVIGSLIGLFFAFGGSIAAVGGAIEIAMGPIGWIALAITALIVIVAEVVKHWTAISSFFSHLWNTVYGFFKKYGAYILDVLFPFVGIPLTIIQNWGTLSKFFSDLWKDITSGLSKAWDAVAGFFDQIWETIKSALFSAWDDIKNFFLDTWKSITKGLSAAWTSVRNTLTATGTWISDKITAIVGWIGGLPGRLARAGSGAFSWMISGLSSAWNWVSGKFNDIVSWVSNMPGRIASAASGMWDGITDAFKDAINWIIRGWNGIQFRIPGFHIGPVGYDGFTLGLPDVPQLAEGGVVNKPTLVMVGDGGQSEKVTPLSVEDKNTRSLINAIKELQDEMAQMRADMLNKLPKATGDAVGNKVADKFDKSAKAGAKATVTLVRQG